MKKEENYILFCNAHKVYYNLLPHIFGGLDSWHIACPDCGRSTLPNKFKTPQSCIKYWNKMIREEEK